MYLRVLFISAGRSRIGVDMIVGGYGCVGDSKTLACTCVKRKVTNLQSPKTFLGSRECQCSHASCCTFFFLNALYAITASQLELWPGRDRPRPALPSTLQQRARVRLRQCCVCAVAKGAVPRAGLVRPLLPAGLL